jgi:hypothetical protein
MFTKSFTGRNSNLASLSSAKQHYFEVSYATVETVFLFLMNLAAQELFTSLVSVTTL